MSSRRILVALVLLCWSVFGPPVLHAQSLELQATLENPIPNSVGFGYSVAGHGDTLAIGAPQLASAGIQRGGVAIYARVGGDWALQQILTRPEGLGFGGSLAVHGDTIVIGRLPYTSDPNFSTVYVYVRNGTTWSFQAELNAGAPKSRPLQIELDGDTAVISYATGGVYVFARNGTTWSEQARLRAEDPPLLPGQTQFHWSGAVEISGNTVVIGTPYEQVNGMEQSGAAHVFVRNGSAWSQQARLTAAVPRERGYFGSSVQLSGNKLFVGASYFERTHTTWSPRPALPAQRVPGGPAGGLYTLVLDGDTAVATFDFDAFTRRSWVFKYVNGEWVRLEPAILNLRGSLALFGNTLASGLPEHGTGINPPGIAYVYAVAEAGTPDPVALAGEVTSNTIGLHWTPGSTGAFATSYVVEAGTSPGASDLYNANVGNIRTLSSPPMPNGSYYIRVRAVNNFGASGPSNEVVLTVGPPAMPVPGPPTLTGSIDNAHQVSLSWTPSAGGGTPTSWWLEAGSSPGASDLFNANVGPTAVIVATVQPGTYYIRVRGVNAGGVGSASNEVVLDATGCTLPSVPNGLHYTREGHVVTVRWNVAPGAVGYTLSAGTEPNDPNLGWFPMGGANSVTVNVPSGRYYVRVRSENTCGPSQLSPELSIEVP